MDGALIERARNGDADAFDELVRSRIDDVYRTAVGLLGNPADARDVTQDALVSAWRSLRSLKDAERFDAWLYRITLNAARMHARKRRKLREIPIADSDRSGANRLSGKSAFDRAFDRLPIEQRALLLAHHLDGLPLSHIADRLGVRVGTVKSRLFAARQALERAMNEER